MSTTVVVHTPTKQQAEELLKYWQWTLSIIYSQEWKELMMDFNYFKIVDESGHKSIVGASPLEQKVTPFATYKSEVIDKDLEYQKHLSNVQNMHGGVKKADELDYGKILPIRCEFKSGGHYLTLVRYADELGIAHDLSLEDATSYANYDMRRYSEKFGLKNKKHGLSFDGKRIVSNFNHKGHTLVEVHEFKKALDGWSNTRGLDETVKTLDKAIHQMEKLKQPPAKADEFDDYKTLYEAAVTGRQHFRDAFKKEREKVKELEHELAEPDYWTQLEHQLVVTSHQALLSQAEHYTPKDAIKISIQQGKALVKKLKGEQ